ncbi:methionyl-tRNA synthetase [Durotheca rogersii]|uniref:methionyl-tRNA synthetase n=1 Tax=Durotheca rogersii TaxID=419775 RepID=UPI00221E8267|nr:methionyl-tRNA synthetase [Durotheca rogersii]KAI5867296.1 methionyl-tRNA synthetase [Durotheca rogersii]
MKSQWGVLSRRLSIGGARPTAHHGWRCQSCRGGQTRRKPFSTTAAVRDSDRDGDGKPYYVTTPIFYVNAAPHVGHLYSMVIADVLKRWKVLKGERSFLSTGTDEHGMKVQRAAELQDVQPTALCDANSEIFRDLARRADISNDCFIRTTDPAHREAVEHFWARLREGGHIYETKHEGWYCVGDETFYSDKMVEKRVSPQTGKPFTASIETGNAVEWTEERNYHFRLTAFREPMLRFYADNPNWVAPSSRFAEVIDWVSNHLEDLSVSRPASRLSWGIPVPDDPSQTIYVWVDALINYITVTGYPGWQQGTGAWPADVHVVGKDILRFHAVYWPALLMAVDLALPRRILSHGHWLMERQKMSKSTGNVVNPFGAIDRWDTDVLRYFLVYHGSVANDANYDNGLILDLAKKGLQRGLGNLLNRIVGPKLWDVSYAVAKMTGDEDRPGLAFLRLPASVDAHKARVEAITDKVQAHMDELDPTGALKEIMELIFETNKFVQETSPWVAAGTGRKRETDLIVFYAAESLRVAGILLQPFMPNKANELLDRLGVSRETPRRSFAFARLQADNAYGKSLIETGKGAWKSLFPPFKVSD